MFLSIDTFSNIPYKLSEQLQTEIYETIESDVLMQNAPEKSWWETKLFSAKFLHSVQHGTALFTA